MKKICHIIKLTDVKLIRVLDASTDTHERQIVQSLVTFCGLKRGGVYNVHSKVWMLSLTELSDLSIKELACKNCLRILDKKEGVQHTKRAGN